MILVSQIIKQIKIVKIYKIALISGIVTQIFFAIFKNYILISFVGSDEQLSPMSEFQTTSYIWLTQILFGIVPWTVNRSDFDSIRKGTVALDLIKPTSIFNLIFSKTVSWKFVGMMARGIPIFLFSLILSFAFPNIGLRLSLPNMSNFLLFIISILLAVQLSTLITTSMYCLAFYFTSITNFVSTIGSVAYILSGMVIPLSFFPKGISDFLNIQPFRYIVDLPAQIFNGLYDNKDSIFGILVQIIWIIIFYVLNLIVYRDIEGKIEINGG
ncbi:ABC transporter permease [Streptococcus oralis]|uniref:ABC transporter permease n=1 Tax=Streptococcus oralis TaxID=1303 RepID=UPI00228337FD|nr:hypothetical protein [Streptococcus oralis]MCY7079211.1 hypothetical protein [Streptococcus oralis]